MQGGVVLLPLGNGGIYNHDTTEPNLYPHRFDEQPFLQVVALLWNAQQPLPTFRAYCALERLESVSSRPKSNLHVAVFSYTKMLVRASNTASCASNSVVTVESPMSARRVCAEDCSPHPAYGPFHAYIARGEEPCSWMLRINKQAYASKRFVLRPGYQDSLDCMVYVALAT
eukprot:589706-Amphidinium_carterae.1